MIVGVRERRMANTLPVVVADLLGPRGEYMRCAIAGMRMTHGQSGDCHQIAS